MKRLSSIPNEAEYEGFIEVLGKNMLFLSGKYFNPDWDRTTSFARTENGFYLKQILDYRVGKKSKLCALKLSMHHTDLKRKGNRVHVQVYEIDKSDIKKVKEQLAKRIKSLKDGELFKNLWHDKILRKIKRKQIGYLKYNLFFEKFFLRLELRNKDSGDLNVLVQDKIFTQFNIVIKNWFEHDLFFC